MGAFRRREAPARGERIAHTHLPAGCATISKRLRLGACGWGAGWTPRPGRPTATLITSQSLLSLSLRAINLAGTTLKEMATDSAAACCAACGETDGCLGYNWCSAEAGCDGGLPTGTCHLKRWDTPLSFAEGWGCSGEAGQGWRSGFMSGMQRWKETPPPCRPPGEAPLAVPGVPGGVRVNWQGAVLILDADGQKMGEGGNHGSPYVRSPYGCATACFAYTNKDGILPNAFTYCDAPEGCGTGCQQFSRGNAAWDGSARDQQFFGPWGKGCSDKNPDAYAYQLCTCKVVDLAAPATNAEPGWVSGPTIEE